MNIELRDYLAAQAMNAQIISVEGVERTNSKQCGVIASCAYAMADAMLEAREAGRPKENGDGWIEWHGGECPVDDNTVVEVRTHGWGSDARRADEFRWGRHAGDIIAYREVQS